MWEVIWMYVIVKYQKENLNLKKASKEAIKKQTRLEWDKLWGGFLIRNRPNNGCSTSIKSPARGNQDIYDQTSSDRGHTSYDNDQANSCFRQSRCSTNTDSFLRDDILSIGICSTSQLKDTSLDQPNTSDCQKLRENNENMPKGIVKKQMRLKAGIPLNCRSSTDSNTVLIRSQLENECTDHYLLNNRLSKFPTLLYLMHQVTSIHILHHKVEPVLRSSTWLM